jgi:hypothetical protein
MKRTGFKRKEPKPFELADRKTTLKRTAMKSRIKKPTVAESEYMGRVAELGCGVCRRLKLGETPAIVHHQRTGQGKMRASHYRTVPLCPSHHQDSGYGVHDMGRPQFEEMYGFSEVDLVEETRAILGKYIPVGR